MIIKGTSRAGPGALAAHLGNAEKNERVQLLETRGTVASDLRGALVEMDAVALGTRCQKPLYHAAMSPEPPHRLTPEQRTEAVDALEQKLGLDGHARVVVMHEKEGREHIHVVWSRINTEQMRSVSDSHNFRKHEECARDLERRFGHDRVQGAHSERDGPDGEVPRPDRTPSRSELRQEERTGITGKQVKEEVSALFRASDSPTAFRSALEEKGYQLCQGDRRDFVIVDEAGGIHSLARRIDSMKAADLRAFMAPLDPASLPTVGEARAVAEERARNVEYDDDGMALEKAYSKGGDYVSQTRAAQKEHDRRLERLRELQEEAGAPRTPELYASREGGDEQKPSRSRSSKDDGPEASVALEVPDGIEITEAMQARLDRLHNAQTDSPSPRDGPGPQRGQNGAPGGGRTRSQ